MIVRLASGVKVGIVAVAAMTFAALPPASLAADHAAMMRLTIDGLIASQTNEGLFPYGFDFLSDKPLEPDRVSSNNLIRQAGTASMLAAYYRQTRDARLLDPLRRALAALERYSLPIGKSRAQSWIERTHLLSLPFARWKLHSALDRFGLLYEKAGAGKVVSPSGAYAEGLAGTTALALLAELQYAATESDDRFAGLRSAWLEGLLMLRIPGGGFRENPTSIDQSDYFNGEGWLAIAVYGENHRNDARIAAELADLDRALIERYTRNPRRNFFHWGVQAAAQRFATTGDERFLEFIRGQADRFVAQFRASLDPDSNHCATMEGVAAALESLNRAGEGDSERARSLRTWLAGETPRLPALQIQPGQTGMPLGGAAQLVAPRMAEFPGAFLQGLSTPSIRVDNGQHCVSAMLMIDRGRLLLRPE